jgi:hypothetical protein
MRFLAFWPLRLGFLRLQQSQHCLTTTPNESVAQYHHLVFHRGVTRFPIGRGQVEFLVGPEVGNQFFDPSECLVEGRWHLRAIVRRKVGSVNSGARLDSVAHRRESGEAPRRLRRKTIND